MSDYIPTIHRIRIWPEDPLHTKVKSVVNFDSRLAQFTEDLIATMRAGNGIGIAAPQIGISESVMVVEIEANNPFVFVNPSISILSEELFSFQEGCLSVPGYFENRKRPRKISVDYQDIKGNKHHITANDLFAFVIQHEHDHLDGKVFVDGSSTFKTSRILKKIGKNLPTLMTKLNNTRQHTEDTT